MSNNSQWTLYRSSVGMHSNNDINNYKLSESVNSNKKIPAIPNFSHQHHSGSSNNITGISNYCNFSHAVHSITGNKYNGNNAHLALNNCNNTSSNSSNKNTSNISVSTKSIINGGNHKDNIISISNNTSNTNNSAVVHRNNKSSCDNFSQENNSFLDDFPPVGVFSNDICVSNKTSSVSTFSPSLSFSSHKDAKNVFKANLNELSSNNQLIRETGIIEKLLHSYGFIQCCERQARLFFHFSQFSGTIEHLKIGDPVEFEMTYDRRTGKPIASTVTKIAPDVVLSEERVTGSVTADLDSKNFTNDIQARITYENKGECFFLPFSKDDVEGNVTLSIGDEVSFQMATNNKGNLSATHIRLENTAHPVKYQGVICSLNDNTGYIERADVVKEIFFCLDDAGSGLTLGDDVEFNIKTKNGREIAYNVEKLPDGTVIFEDISEEVVKGQVLKTHEKNSPTENGEPVPGKIKYRASDHSEVEVSYGEKDQLGEFTLRHGDWVEFRIATDRRDQLKRATCISLLEDSFLVSGEKRENGVVTRIKDDIGYLQPSERNYKVAFKLSEVLDISKKVVSGDEFEFTIVQDPSCTFSNNMRLIAIRLKYLKAGTVKFDKLIEANVTGVISRLPMDINGVTDITEVKQGSSDDEHSPEPGIITFVYNGAPTNVNFYRENCEHGKNFHIEHKVKFDLYQVTRNKEFIAKNIENIVMVNRMTNSRREHNYNIRKEREIRRTNDRVKQVHHGFIIALKEGYGFIESSNFEREYFFHFSHVEGNPLSLKIGSEVEYTVNVRNTANGNPQAVENIRLLPSINLPTNTSDEKQPVLCGIIRRPLRSVNPNQEEYCGLIQEITSDGQNRLIYEYGVVSLKDKREILQKDDQVSFQIDSYRKPFNVRSTRKKLLSTVEAVKGQFGFLSYTISNGKRKLFFHMSQVRNGATLKVGDTVEFFFVTNNRTGRSAACDVVKISDGGGSSRTEQLVNRIRSIEPVVTNVIIMRSPKGPSENSNGFDTEYRKSRKSQ